MAKECVEPYGEIVQVSDFETIVRVKPECEAMQRAAVARRTGKKPEEVVLAAATTFDVERQEKSSLLPTLPDADVLSVRRRSASKRAVSCSDPAVCGRTRVAHAVKPFSCDDGRGYAVSVSYGLAEVRIADECRHLMNPKIEAASFVVPNVLAPDWELVDSPKPRKRSRARNGDSSCADATSCETTPPAKGQTQDGKASPPPTEMPTSGALSGIQEVRVQVEWQDISYDLGHSPRLLATRNRRLPGAIV
ncbi:MAG: hypothetical protein R3D57_16885 [Hyphomicrobiaceae bacterium]